MARRSVPVAMTVYLFHALLHIHQAVAGGTSQSVFGRRWCGPIGIPLKAPSIIHHDKDKLGRPQFQGDKHL